MDLTCSFGNLIVSGHEDTIWRLAAQAEITDDIEEIVLVMEAGESAVPPEITINWHLSLDDIFMRWTAFHTKTQWLLPPVWADDVTSSLAYGMPLITFLNPQGMNRATVAFSDAIRPVKIKAGVFEDTPDIEFHLSLFTSPEAPRRRFAATLRIDRRKVFYSDAISDAVEWFAAFAEYKPASVPESASEPVYSTWYNYHQNLFAEELEDECRSAIKHNIKTIIVDDGWQTDDNRKKYTYCGDWQMSKRRFPDMKKHVEKIHSIGMNYMLWYAIPFLGRKSDAAERFKDKTLIFAESMDAYVLDPRFPDVREYLISTYENAIREWDIDGFKFDFIDSFQHFCEDPALKDNYAGRDILTLPEAVDCLLSDTIKRLGKLKKDILIEFRQSYMGPAIRKYGNIIRVSDCPCDYLSNRVGMVKLRLTSGKTRVHSDMIEWDPRTTAENAILQLLNVFFCVPQISIRFNEIPNSHIRALDNYLSFWSKHKTALLDGKFVPISPEANYPVISAAGQNDKITVIYDHQIVLRLDKNDRHVINATTADSLIIDFRENIPLVKIYDAFGEKQDSPKHLLRQGITEIFIPPSGRLEVIFEP